MTLATVHLLRRPTVDGWEYELVILPAWLDAELPTLNRYPHIDVSRERGGRLVLRPLVDGGDTDAMVRDTLTGMGVERVTIAEASAVCQLCRSNTPVAVTHFGETCEVCLDSLRVAAGTSRPELECA